MPLESELTRTSFVASSETPTNPDDALSLAAHYETMGSEFFAAAEQADPKDQPHLLVTAARLDGRAQTLFTSAMHQDAAARGPRNNT